MPIADPAQAYRKKVRSYIDRGFAKTGEFDRYIKAALEQDRIQINQLSKSELSTNVAETTVNSLLQPIRQRLENLKSYRQAFREHLEEETLEESRDSLKVWREIVLKLTDADVEDIEREGQQQSGTRKTRENKLHRENLGNDVSLDLVAIPAGSFQMGSTEYGDEQPVHQVTIAPFFLGKYPVTQAQWEAVAAFPKVNLDLNPEPSYFEGNDRPVETVSWWDVMEFCDRLTRKTKHTYRLPSEAEWEYACRAGTTTPFHFGETIATDLANYDGNFTYGSGVKGEYRKQTTPVGSFNVANVFGLYDMHGNVREWCADHWHKNYEGAPIDGSAWLTDNKDAKRLMRGGSWGDNPVVCRSAFRYYYDPGVRDLDLGFRVVCVLA